MTERIAVVKGCRYVDEVIGNAPLVIDHSWIEHHQIDLVVHSDDLSEELETRMYEVPIEMGIYRTVTYTPAISTTDIIKRCKAAISQINMLMISVTNLGKTQESIPNSLEKRGI